jgi:tetraacyldisaccharide 4'-kinase
MRAPGFWWRPRPGALARLLQPLGWVYGAVTLSRMRRAGEPAGVPVICVGNFVAGGAGKTPTSIAIAALLRQRGETPFILTRGYGGSLIGPVEVDPARHRASEAGDEALLLAREARTIKAGDRRAGAALAVSLGASVIVMDDGLQNPALTKQLRLAVVDGASGVGNGLCVPAGPLRAPLPGQFELTDAVVVIGEGSPGEAGAAQAAARGLGVVGAWLSPMPGVTARLVGQPLIAVSGIGRPEKFIATLEAARARIVARHSLVDHHAYTAEDVAKLLSQAKAMDCQIATTEKDMTKLAPLWPEAELARLVVVPVALQFADAGQIRTLLDRALAKRA